MRASAWTLPTFEISVRRGCAALAGPKLVGVHGEAHRAAGAPPLCASGREDLVKALAFRLLGHGDGSGDDQHLHRVSDLAAAKHVGDDPKVLDATVCAGADEDGVEDRKSTRLNSS